MPVPDACHLSFQCQLDEDGAELATAATLILEHRKLTGGGGKAKKAAQAAPATSGTSAKFMEAIKEYPSALGLILPHHMSSIDNEIDNEPSNNKC